MFQSPPGLSESLFLTVITKTWARILSLLQEDFLDYSFMFLPCFPLPVPACWSLSQNGWGWKGLQDIIIWSDPSAQTGPARASCPGPFPEETFSIWAHSTTSREDSVLPQRTAEGPVLAASFPPDVIILVTTTLADFFHNLDHKIIFSHFRQIPNL